jgi:hypothetical protein
LNGGAVNDSALLGFGRLHFLAFGDFPRAQFGDAPDQLHGDGPREREADRALFDFVSRKLVL